MLDTMYKEITQLPTAELVYVYKVILEYVLICFNVGTFVTAMLERAL